MSDEPWRFFSYTADLYNEFENDTLKITNELLPNLSGAIEFSH